MEIDPKRPKPSSVWVTGGMGFIGSHLTDYLLQDEVVVNVDSLTYAASEKTRKYLETKPNHHFLEISILDSLRIRQALTETRPKVIFHLAAESHVDRSIQGPLQTVETNALGTQVLLSEVSQYWSQLPAVEKDRFRFIHVSTDEVYGDLSLGDPPFTETSPFAPRSAYAASKAASDHLVMAESVTHGLPVIITHCSNNFGSRQHPEKFIPTVIQTAISGESIPIYGTGQNQRDWIAVEDHVAGLLAAAKFGKLGENYLFGSGQETSNLNLAQRLTGILDQLQPRADQKSYSEQITFVDDRLGHDFRYAIDATKAKRELGWSPQTSLNDSLSELVTWYLKNPNWHQKRDFGLSK